MLSYNLDFNSCAIRDGFRKSSHKLCHTMENDWLKINEISITDSSLHSFSLYQGRCHKFLGLRWSD